jgi:exodeoxyribonuclease-3
VKLISWNVNGLRAVVGRGGLAPVIAQNPDIVCLQETKAGPGDLEEILPDYPFQYWSSGSRKGYAGTALFTRIEPLNTREGIGVESYDSEGRAVTVELEDYWIVSLYTPNAGRGLSRLEFRMQWDRALLDYLHELGAGKPVVFCGDMNVAHEEIDLARPKANRRNAGFTDEERKGFSALLESGFLDSFRMFNEGPGHYTWWSYMYNARAKNVGWRIDYVCVSRALGPRVKEAFILREIEGSDHCPVGVVLE